jgi:hypothetical protein
MTTREQAMERTLRSYKLEHYYANKESDCGCYLCSRTTEILALPADPPVTDTAQPRGEHSDDIAVNGFALAMKRKMKQKRGEGYGGWDKPKECDVEHLAYLFVDHLRKPDMVDIANFAMMLHYRIGGGEALVKEYKERISAAEEEAMTREQKEAE